MGTPVSGFPLDSFPEESQRHGLWLIKTDTMICGVSDCGAKFRLRHDALIDGGEVEIDGERYSRKYCRCIGCDRIMIILTVPGYRGEVDP